MSMFESALRMEIEDRCRDLDRRKRECEANGERFACTMAESALLQDFRDRAALASAKGAKT